jgi:murein DD-endopeptidase MepM/ murein hydrolase activator NlpD
MELVFKTTNQAVLDQLNSQYRANTAAIDQLNKELDDAVVSETEFRRASARLHDEKRRLEQQLDAVTQAMREETAAAGRLKTELGDQGIAGAAEKGRAGLDKFASAMMQVGVLYDDIQYGSKNVANNLFAIGMAIPEPRLRLFMTTLGFLTAAFHKQIDAGLAWAGVLDENVVKGLDNGKAATDKLTASVAGLDEKLKAAAESSRELDDAEKERRENLAKALTAPSQAQSNDATQAQAILNTMGGGRFDGFVRDLITKNISGSIDPNSPAGKVAIARQTNAMQAGVVGGDAAQARGLLDMMARMPAILAKWNVDMPAPMAAGFGAGQKTDAQIAKEADEARAAKIREDLAKEEEAKRKAEEDRRKAEAKAADAAAKAEEDRFDMVRDEFDPAASEIEKAGLGDGATPEAIASDVYEMARAGGASMDDALRLAAETFKEMATEQTAAINQFTVQVQQAAREAAMARQRAARALQMQNQMNPWNNNRPGWP